MMRRRRPLYRGLSGRALNRENLRAGILGALKGQGPRLPSQQEVASPSREDGTILPLVLGLCLVLFLVASTVVGVSAVYLERHKLQALADQTASAAAQRVDNISQDPDADVLIYLSPEGVRSSAGEFLTGSGAAAHFSELTLDSNSGVDGANTAVVVLRARAHPPLVSVVVPDGFEIRAVGRARTQGAQG